MPKTTADLLTLVHDIRAAYSAAQLAPAAAVALDALQKELTARIHAEAARTAGTGSAARAVAAMLRPMERSRRALAYPWTDADGKQCTCDGYRAFRLAQPLPLPERPEDAGEPIDLGKIFPTAARVASAYKPVELPALADVKAFIQIHRAENKNKRDVPVWDFGEGLPAVNARYLADLITVMGAGCTLYACTDRNGLFSVMYASSERGDAVLLPIRTPEKAEQSERAAQERKPDPAPAPVPVSAADVLREYAAAVAVNADHSMSAAAFAAIACTVHPAA